MRLLVLLGMCVGFRASMTRLRLCFRCGRAGILAGDNVKSSAKRTSEAFRLAGWCKTLSEECDCVVAVVSTRHVAYNN